MVTEPETLLLKKYGTAAPGCVEGKLEPNVASFWRGHDFKNNPDAHPSQRTRRM